MVSRNVAGVFYSNFKRQKIRCKAKYKIKGNVSCPEYSFLYHFLARSFLYPLQ